MKILKFKLMLPGDDGPDPAGGADAAPADGPALAGDGGAGPGPDAGAGDAEAPAAGDAATPAADAKPAAPRPSPSPSTSSGLDPKDEALMKYLQQIAENTEDKEKNKVPKPKATNPIQEALIEVAVPDDNKNPAGLLPGGNLASQAGGAAMRELTGIKNKATGQDDTSDSLAHKTATKWQDGIGSAIEGLKKLFGKGGDAADGGAGVAAAADDDADKKAGPGGPK